MSSMKVQGKAIFQGDKVVLTLKPDQMPKKKAAKEPRIVRVKPLPDAHQLVEDVNNGRTACHSTRRPISVQYVQVMIRNIQMALNLRESGASWSVDAHDRLLELLLKPKLKRGKTAAIVDDEVESNDPSNAANMLENNVPQCNLNEMEPIVAEVPSSAYARNNEKDDVTEDKVKKDDVNKDNMNKRGAIQDDMDEDIVKKVDVEKENKKEDDVQQGDGHEDQMNTDQAAYYDKTKNVDNNNAMDAKDPLAPTHAKDKKDVANDNAMDANDLLAPDAAEHDVTDANQQKAPDPNMGTGNHDTNEDSSFSDTSSSTSSTSSSSSTAKATLRRKIGALENEKAILQNDLDEVTRDLYIANDALGLHDFYEAHGIL